MILYLVRHGETDFNIQKRYTGSTDIPINCKGIEQANQLAEKLKQNTFDIIITSSLICAKQTVEIINKTLNLSIVVINEFSERNLGVYEGLTHDEIKKKHPDLWERNCIRQADDAPTNGETWNEFDNRIKSALQKLENNYHGKNVLLVAHAGVAMIINRYYKNLTFEEMCNGFRLGNCEIVEYTIKT